MKVIATTGAVLAALSLLPSNLAAQLGSLDAMSAQAHAGVGGKVMTDDGKPIPGATVEIYSRPLRVLETDRLGEFQAEFQFYSPEDLRYFSAIMKVSKKGFGSAHKLIEFSSGSKFLTIPVTLRPAQADPSVLSLAELTRGVAPGLRQVGETDGLTPRVERDYVRGVQDFLDRPNQLDRAIPSLSKIAKTRPECFRCRTMLSLAELAWGDWDGANAELGDEINDILKDKKPACSDPFLVYGVLLTWKHNTPKAVTFLQEALKRAPGAPLVLQELGRAQGQMFDWESANETLANALAMGAGPDARLLHAEALLWAGTAPEARKELDLYLNGRDTKALPTRVRELSERINEREKDAKAFAVVSARMKAQGKEPLDYLTQVPKGLNGFEPATDQSLLDSILAFVGRRVAEFYTNLPNTSSVEVIHQEMLGKNGRVGLTQQQKFNYLCMIPSMPWGPSTDEYRADSRGNLATPNGIELNFMLTSGFLAAPLVFHPAYQRGSAYHYWGRETINGTPTYLIAFAQRPAESRIYGSFQMGSVSRQTYFQGLAWVDTSSYQIVRLTTDLLTPLPQVKLNKETTDIEFKQVQFSKAKQIFWLPRLVTVTLDWNGHTLRNSHAYSDFHVFKVDQKQEIASPKNVADTQPNPQQ